MAFYFNKKGTKTQIDMTSIDLNGTLWKYKTKPTAGSVDWKASTVGVGTVGESYFETKFKDKNQVNWYYAIPSSSTNAIHKIGFVIQNGKWWINEIVFRNKFSGTIKITAKSFSGGGGTSGSSIEVLNQVGEEAVSASKYAYSGSNFPSYGFGLGGFAGIRYSITITATSTSEATSGETYGVVIPLIYCSSKVITEGSLSAKVYNITIESGMTATGYDPMQRNTKPITSDNMGDQSNLTQPTPTHLNLNDPWPVRV